MINQNDKILKGRKIWVGLSGGVDSAVAALILKEAGARVTAVFMKNWDDDDTEAGCHDKDDLITAVAVAESLGLDFEVINYATDYWRLVFEPFLRGLAACETPNPDIWCNSRIKFSLFWEEAERAGAEGIATGHYARLAVRDGKCVLRKGEDSAKDQTYFLYRLNQGQLAGASFPIGGLHKAEVRERARAFGLKNWQRKDSTGICFIGERRFKEFIGRYLPPEPGDITDEKGEKLGRHDGLMFYTIGQRKGLGIGGEGGGWFVAGKDERNNILQVVQGENHPSLFTDTVTLREVHWIADVPPPTHWVYAARLRHRQFPASCTLTRASETTATIVFAEPQRAPAAGQHAVIYDGEVCLGGGVITAPNGRRASG